MRRTPAGHARRDSSGMPLAKARDVRSLRVRLAILKLPTLADSGASESGARR